MNKMFLLFALIGLIPGLSFGKQNISFACNYFPPQKITSPKESSHPGYDVEILASVISDMGHETTFEFFPWNRAYEMVKTGKRDGLCSCSYLPEREEDFVFSEPIGLAVRGVFYRDDAGIKSSEILTLNHLKGKKTAVVRGYNLESELKEAGVENIEVVNTDKLLLNLLLFKRVDYIYSYESTILFELQQLNPAPVLAFRGFGETPYYACFSRRTHNSIELVKSFNDALHKMKQDGRYRDIMLRYRAP